jgi:hypothetical protein
MAIDTRNKRSSAVHVGSPWRTSLPVGDGTVDQGDRQHAAGYYGAVLLAPVGGQRPNARVLLIQLGLKGVA